MSLLLFLPPPPLSKSWSLPSASIRDCLGYSPLCPHTVSSSATCSPVYPTRLFFFCVASSHAFFLRCVCTLLTSRWFPRQSRSACLWTLSSDGCRTSVSAAWGPAGGGREGKLESSRHLWWRTIWWRLFFNRIRQICPFGNKWESVVIF